MPSPECRARRRTPTGGARRRDTIPPETFRRNDFIWRATSLAALGREAEARAATAEALARFPNLTIEAFAVAEPGWSEAERQLLVRTMRAAGFPPCAKPEEIATLGMPARLSDCAQADATK